MDPMSPGPDAGPVPDDSSLPPRDSRVAYGALFSGTVMVMAGLAIVLDSWWFVKLSQRTLGLLIAFYGVAAVVGVVAGIAGVAVTRGRRLNGRIFAVTGLILGILGVACFVPVLLIVAFRNWDFSM